MMGQRACRKIPLMMAVAQSQRMVTKNLERKKLQTKKRWSLKKKRLQTKKRRSLKKKKLQISKSPKQPRELVVVVVMKCVR